MDAAAPMQLLSHDARSGARELLLDYFRISPGLPEECFRVPRAVAQRLNDALIVRAWRSSQVRITSEAGTDLTVKLDRRYKWTNSCCLFAGRHPGIAPPSEISTFSEQVN